VLRQTGAHCPRAWLHSWGHAASCQAAAGRTAPHPSPPLLLLLLLLLLRWRRATELRGHASQLLLQLAALLLQAVQALLFLLHLLHQLLQLSTQRRRGWAAWQAAARTMLLAALLWHCCADARCC
jgi:MYXO-CTERM domain-containing protein